MRCVHTFIASQYNQIGSCKLQCWEGGGGEGLVKWDIISYRGGMKCDGGGGGVSNSAIFVLSHLWTAP